MEDNNTQNQENQTSTQNIQTNAKSLITDLKKFLVELLDFRHDTDHQATIEAIKNDIPLKGATAWILIFAIFVASIGLNANSTAVVIGAMLISPLMGPILGIGMSIAVNDIDTLKKSGINLATMIVLSLLASSFFFWAFPLSEDTSELLGRVKPDIRDVLIAFFGGLALMVARTKKGTIASVIFGVAIATALMPPLCTAGYGIAKWNLDYFLGAMYLFIINTIFIALATFLVLKLLRFPMHKYANTEKRKQYAWIVSGLGLLVMIPAVLTFLNVLQESRYQNDYKKFLDKEIRANNDLWLYKEDMQSGDKKISLFFNGEVPDVLITQLQNEIKDYPNIADFTLNIDGNKTRSIDKISESLDRAYTDLDKKENIINGLQKQIEELQGTVALLNNRIDQDAIAKDKNTIPFNTVAKEAKIRFSNIKELWFSNKIHTKDFIKVDTIPEILVKWNAKLKVEEKEKKQKEFKNWVEKELKLEKLEVNNIN